nr:Arc family DNA-binding protein [Paracoccus saliphilus]
MAKPPVSEQVQVNFRMPVDLRDRIKAAAESSGRSMNAEIVATLEEHYPSAPLKAGELFEEVMKLSGLLNATPTRHRPYRIKQLMDRFSQRGAEVDLSLDGNRLIMQHRNAALRLEVDLEPAEPWDEMFGEPEHHDLDS